MDKKISTDEMHWSGSPGDCRAIERVQHRQHRLKLPLPCSLIIRALDWVTLEVPSNHDSVHLCLPMELRISLCGQEDSYLWIRATVNWDKSSKISGTGEKQACALWPLLRVDHFLRKSSVMWPAGNRLGTLCSGTQVAIQLLPPQGARDLENKSNI